MDAICGSLAAQWVAGLNSTTNQYVALINLKNGLCKGFKVDARAVYIFEEFRNDKKTAKANQESQLSDKIKEWKNDRQNE